MEKLREVVSGFGEEMNLQFNPNKSGIVEFAVCPDSERALKVQNQSPPVLENSLCNSTNYLKEPEKVWEVKAEKVLNAHQISMAIQQIRGDGDSVENYGCTGTDRRQLGVNNVNKTAAEI